MYVSHFQEHTKDSRNILHCGNNLETKVAHRKSDESIKIIELYVSLNLTFILQA